MDSLIFLPYLIEIGHLSQLEQSQLQKNNNPNKKSANNAKFNPNSNNVDDSNADFNPGNI
jgi:hypothetical protein